MDMYFIFFGVFIFCYALGSLSVANRVATTSTEHTWCINTMVASTICTVLVEDLIVFYLAFEVMLLVMYVCIASH